MVTCLLFPLHVDVSSAELIIFANLTIPARERRDEMISSFVLPSDPMDEIDRVLTQLHQKTQASCILLADISGQLIGERGRREEIDPAILAALTASNMAATAEIARQIGEETSFRLLFHEGERRNIYLSSVGDSFLLVVVFNTTVQVGLVRLFTKQAVKQLLSLAEEFEALQSQADQVVDADFGDALVAEMESIFGSREQS
jgi:predicted regulator of Ras-like GTPase activity (Roadblock/LC7/MglB family)